METRTYTLEIEVDVTMTSKGDPGRGVSFSDPGEPPIGPEFEADNITVAGKVINAMTARDRFGDPYALQRAIVEAIEEAAIEAAEKDSWGD